MFSSSSFSFSSSIPLTGSATMVPTWNHGKDNDLTQVPFSNMIFDTSQLFKPVNRIVGWAGVHMSRIPSTSDMKTSQTLELQFNLNLWMSLVSNHHIWLA